MFPAGYKGPPDFTNPYRFPVEAEAVLVGAEAALEEAVFVDHVVFAPDQPENAYTTSPSAPPLDLFLSAPSEKAAFAPGKFEEAKEEIASPSALFEDLVFASAPTLDIVFFAPSEEAAILTNDGERFVISPNQLQALAVNSEFFASLQENPASYSFETNSFNLQDLLNKLERAPSDLSPAEIARFLLTPLLPAVHPSSKWCTEVDEILSRQLSEKQSFLFLCNLFGVDRRQATEENVLISDPEMYRQFLLFGADLPVRFSHFSSKFPLLSKRLMVKYGNAYAREWRKLGSKDATIKNRAIQRLDMSAQIRGPISFSNTAIETILKDTSQGLDEVHKWNFISGMNICSYTHEFSIPRVEEFGLLSRLEGIRQIHFKGYFTQNSLSLSSFAPMYRILEEAGVALTTDFSNPLRRLRTMTVEEAMRVLELNPAQKMAFKAFSLTLKKANFLNSSANADTFFSCFDERMERLTLINENSDFDPDILYRVHAHLPNLRKLRIKYQGETFPKGESIPNSKPLLNLDPLENFRFLEDVSIVYADITISSKQLEALNRVEKLRSLSLEVTVEEQRLYGGPRGLLQVSLKDLPGVAKAKRISLLLHAKEKYKKQRRHASVRDWQLFENLEEMTFYGDMLPSLDVIKRLQKLRRLTLLYPEQISPERKKLFGHEAEKTAKQIRKDVAVSGIEEYRHIYES